jgi:hypothetical protein
MTNLNDALPGLMAFRERVGAESSKGRLATMVIEGIIHLPEWKPMPYLCDERQTPLYWIRKNLARLGG